MGAHWRDRVGDVRIIWDTKNQAVMSLMIEMAPRPEVDRSN